MTTKPTRKTETEIIFEGNLELTEDFTTKKNLIVKGRIFGKDYNKFNINARDINCRNIDCSNINCWDINCWDIDCRNIICEKRIKKSESAKTIAIVYITNKSQIERREHD